MGRESDGTRGFSWDAIASAAVRGEGASQRERGVEGTIRGAGNRKDSGVGKRDKRDKRLGNLEEVGRTVRQCLTGVSISGCIADVLPRLKIYADPLP